MCAWVLLEKCITPLFICMLNTKSWQEKLALSFAGGCRGPRGTQQGGPASPGQGDDRGAVRALPPPHPRPSFDRLSRGPHHLVWCCHGNSHQHRQGRGVATGTVMPRGPVNWQRRERIEPVPARGAGPGSLSHPAGITARIINCCTSLAPRGCRHGVLEGCSWLLTTLPVFSCLAEPVRECNPQQGSGAVLAIRALPSLPALLPVLVILPNGRDLIFPFFFFPF